MYVLKDGEKFEDSAAPLQIESGRWRDIACEERVCRECERGEVEDVNHSWLLPWPMLAVERDLEDLDLLTAAGIYW